MIHPLRIPPTAIILTVVVTGAIVLTLIFFGTPAHFLGLDLNSQEITISGDKAVLIKQDASQRAVLFIPKAKDGKGGLFTACSEPPPDAAQHLAQSLNSSINLIGKKEPSSESQSSEAAAKISGDLKSAAEALFQRSQGIQLLRDTMFRLCEGLQNGVIPSPTYAELMGSLIKTANFIIPFEQCTGIVRANDRQLPQEVVAPVLTSCLQAALVFSRNPIPSQDQIGTPLVPAPVTAIATTHSEDSHEPSRNRAAACNTLVTSEINLSNASVARFIQDRLAKLGFQPGPLDGNFGQKSRTALREFQKQHELDVTDSLDCITWQALSSTRFSADR